MFRRLILVTVFVFFPLSPMAATRLYVPNQSSNTVSVVNADTATVTGTISVGTEPYGVAVSPDGSTVYVTNLLGDTLSVIDVGSGSVVATISVGDFPFGVAASADGRYVYVANGGDGAVSVIDAGSRTVIGSIAVGADPHGVALSPDGSRLYVTNYSGSSVSVVNTSNRSVVKTIPVGAGPHGISVSPDGNWIYVANVFDGTVSIVGAESLSVLRIMNSGTWPFVSAASPNGTEIFASNYGDANVTVFNVASGDILAKIPVGPAPHGVCFSRDNSRAFVANEAGNSVSVIDVASRTVVATVPVGSKPIAFGSCAVEVADEPHEMAFTIEPGTALPGSMFSWKYSAKKKNATAVDVYAALVIPDLGLLFLGETGLTPDPVPHKRGLSVTDGTSVLLGGFPLPSGLPQGTYTFYGLMVRSGGSLFDSANWLSNLASASMYFSRISPTQNAFVARVGYPSLFSKEFSDDDGIQRVDEHWLFPRIGQGEYFINGAFVAETPMNETVPDFPVGKAHPEDYAWDTTIDDIVAMHGQPATMYEDPTSVGTLLTYVYETIAFAFFEGRLLSVMALE